MLSFATYKLFHEPVKKNEQMTNSTNPKSAMVVVRHEVKHADHWREQFKTHGELFQTQSVSEVHLGACGEDKVVAVFVTTNLDEFLRIFNDAATADAQANDGITGGVETYVIDETYVPAAD